MTNREIIKEFFKNKYEGKKLNGVPNLIRSRKEKDIEICKILVEETKYLPENCKLTERFYQVVNDLYEIPKCEVCGVNSKHFVDFNTGYTENCSNKCVGKNPNRLEKRKATTLEKYGVEHAIQSDTIKEKMKDIFLEKYGETNPNKVESIKEKKKKVFIEKYGVDNPMKDEDIKNKVKDTCLEKYGSHYSLGNEEVKEKSKQTCLEKYGTENVLSNKDIQEKIKSTMLEKYGVESVFANR